MTPFFVPFHVASHTKRLSAALLRTLERLLASVAIVVNLETTRP
jgi:hypothetical protein